MDSPGRTRRIISRDAIAASVFLSPSFVGLAVFTVVPILAAVAISLLRWDLVSPPQYVGGANYARLWDELVTGKTLRIVLANTIYYTVGTVPLAMGVSLAVALLLNRNIRGVTTFRAVYFLPPLCNVAAISLIWRWMYNPEYGVINSILGLLHLPRPGWLASPDWAMPAVIIMSVWSSIGYNSVLFLAGLKGVERTYYEAAEIDGATVWQKFRHVTWPLLSPTTLFIFTMAIIAGFQVFGQIYMLTDGKATPETQVYVYNIYQEAFVSLRMGYASALACVLFSIILAVTLTQLSITKRWVHYG